ncbi:arginyl-tRNA--protein transferase 1 isoform X1 [Metopolophium dirhodum]|uniref:arginyl-tRNA--protein transferase 1 isoform X1 n=1 Tax=Metopolophium dirhodum TaxID=44670 RepID=UPI00298FD9E4|nr:arginyl-tRNA--protein transferase 1 isoform X1 [Metopolophium dirhodum]XP_060856734.1 arginyl-tRNA--protein transferase 1 isoform X1 [Metopolophium dirhodum]XP_060856735.1 arginyl-tRNA--protein transferase 1 isoform X1 [Metopolophium dirhodum]
MQSINTKSIIFYNGSTKRSSCGYCKKENSSFSNGMWASSLSVVAYQDMIDRGWRRAGKYCYKALMEKTCCPLYTIRCEALNVELSKSQKKIIKRVTTFLKNGECEKNPVNTEQAEREPIMKYKLEDIQNHDDKMKITNTDYLFDEEQSASVIGSHNSTLITTNKEDNKMVEPLNLSCNSDTKKEPKKFKPGEGADPNLPSSKKKKLLRIQKKLAKDPNFVTTISAPYQKCLEEFIAENDSVSTGGLQKLRVSLVKTGTEAFAQTFTAGATLFAKYQIAVHNDKADECNMEQYLSFLVDSPLKEEKSKHPDHPGYGSFHQQYWLGDKLIAVGVIDILPKCVSSVYLFYDPDYHNLVLGTYSSLREICLVRQLYKMSPDLKYYYMGFYIHSCSKMRYKAKFRPSYLLCPLKYTWHAIDKCIQKLDNEKYSIFDVSGDIQDADIFTIDNIPVLYRGSLMHYSAFKIIGNNENEDERIKEYKILIGPKLARKLIYCIMD